MLLLTHAPQRPVVIAEHEDEPVNWYEGTCSRRSALRDMAHLCGEPAWVRWRWRLAREYLRPATRADCQCDPPNVGGCCMVDEGWHVSCDAAYPGAIPVWRVEWTGGTELGHKIRMRLRRLHRVGRPLDQRRCVLWGGHVERRATWFDRLLLGPTYLVIRGDRWLCLNETEWRWCYGCGRLTPHRATSWPMLRANGWCCEALDHRAVL